MSLTLAALGKAAGKGLKSLTGASTVGGGLLKGGKGLIDTAEPLSSLAIRNKSTDLMAGINEMNQDFVNQEFLSRNRDALKNLMTDTNLGQSYRTSQMGGLTGMIGGARMNNKLEDIQQELKPMAQAYKAGENRKIGNEISNSTPMYTTPSYGKKGMKFRPSSKFSSLKK